MNHPRKFLALLLCAVMMIGILPMSAIAAETNGLDNFKKVNTYKAGTFSDVSPSDWYYDNVKAAYELGLMIGQGENFGVNSDVTVAETVTLAARLHAIYSGGNEIFAQGTPWYQVYVDYVTSKNLVSLSDLDMTAPATRAQYANILGASLPDEALESINNVADDAIPDVKMGDTYASAIYRLYRAGILTGNDSNGTFSPDSKIKRSEVAAIVTRMADTSLRRTITLGEFYTITFNFNYSGSTDQTQSVEVGKTVTSPTNPTRSGYTFNGWYIAASGGERFDFNSKISSDITLYAHWSSNYSGGSGGGGYTPIPAPTQTPTPVTTADYTRGEWVSALAEKLSMSLSDDTTNINYYYADTEGNKNGVAIETASAYGILPEPEIEDIDQDVPLFYPNEPATREFAAYTAIKAMGFDGTHSFDTSSWNDLASIKYPDEMAIAVGYSFLSLDNSKFKPKSNLTKTEANEIFAAIDALNESIVVSTDNAFDNSVYATGVMKDELVNFTNYRVVDNRNGTYGVYVISDDVSIINVAVEDVIVLPANDEYPVGIAFKVNSIDDSPDNELRMICIKPEIYEVFTEIDFAGAGTAIVGGVTTAEDITCEYDTSGIEDDNSDLYPLDIDLGGSYKVPGKLKFTLPNKELSDDLKLSGSVEIEIPDVTCIFNAHVDLFNTEVHEFTLSIQEKIKFKTDLTYTLVETGYELTNDLGVTRWKKGRVELGRLPIAIGATGLSFDIVFFYNIEAKGTASISYTIVSTQGYQYKNGTSRVIFDFDDSLDFLEIKGSAKAGLGIAGDLCAFALMDLVGYSVEAGAALNVSFTPHILATDSLYCGDLTLYAYCTSGLDKETVVGKFLDKVCHYTLEFEHLKNDENNPAKLKLHIENGRIVKECTFGTGGISGYVASHSDNRPLEQARINIYSTGSLGDNLVRTLYTNSAGKFSVDNLHAGTYKVIVSATGYFSYEWTLEVSKTETTYVETLLMIDRNGNTGEMGSVTGTIADAVSGFGISGSTYKLRNGWNMTSGQVLTEGTFADSNYSLAYAVGNYTLEVNRDDYMTNWVNIAIAKGNSTPYNIVLTPSNMQTGVMRIVLTWGDTPPDIDSHTFGPTLTDASQEFHIYFANKDFDNGNITLDLDLDDTDGHGPETTTITMLNGNEKYSYYIHDFTNKSKTNSTALSMSGAKVQVYIGNSVRTFNIPTNREGTVWHVFDYDAATATITPVNEFSYSSDETTLGR